MLRRHNLQWELPTKRLPTKAANVPLARWVEREAAGWLKVAYLVALFAALFANVVAIGWWLRSKPRRFGLLCGACGAALDGLIGYTVVATGNCGVCGVEVFAESVRAADAEPGAAPDTGRL